MSLPARRGQQAHTRENVANEGSAITVTTTSGGGSSPTQKSSWSSRASTRNSKTPKVPSSTAREDARKRTLDMRAEVEGVIHVLDGGINRTPLPLQRRQSLMGGMPHESQILGSGGTSGFRTDTNQEAGSTTNLMELGSSFMHSSFMLNSSRRSSIKPDSTAMSAHGQSKGSNETGDQGSSIVRRGMGVDIRSLDSSLQSLSFACDNRMSDRSLSIYESPSKGRRSIAGAGSAADVALPRLAQRNTLLEETVYTPPPPLTANEKAAWRKETTIVLLTETPTIFLYSHQDEAVSNEYVDKVNAVVARNREYAAVEETYRTDEGTQFQSTGAITMRAPMKSVQTEVHSPAKKDSGALQVTPWMLKDAYAAALEASEDAEVDAQEERQQQVGDTANDAAGGGAATNVEDSFQDGDGMDCDGSLEDDYQSSENGQSTVMSSETVTHTISSDGAIGSSAKALGGASADTGLTASKQWMLAETLLPTLRIMERAVVQNNMEAVQLAYRGITVKTLGQGTGSVSANRTAPPAFAAGVFTPASGTRTSAVVPGALPAALNAHATGPQDALGDGAAMTAGTGVETAATVDTKSTQLVDGMESAHPDAAEKLTSPGTDPYIDAPPLRLSEGIRLLWRFGSPQLTYNRGVSCMTWNKRESDMLAVGYTACRHSLVQGNAGNRSSDNSLAMVYKRSQGQEAHGMICCWSLKNPLAPELVLYLRGEADVTTLAFSFEHPSLLAVGSSTGEIVVYDIQHDVLNPSIAPAIVGTTGGQHTGSIWELQWVPKGKENGEFLTSISADGRVVQWAVGKSIERVPPDLMHLHRQPGIQVEKAFVSGVAEAEAAAATLGEPGVGGKGKGKTQHRKSTQKHAAGASSSRGAGGGGSAEEAMLSQQCGGMCFDICPSDTAVYIVGTEDGSVLQCSKSQTENYDFEYDSHAELVYRVRWSPYSAAYFLTCSADWTSRLYKVGKRKAQLQFHSVRQDAVQDVAWSHTNAVTFATVTAQGNAEVWSVMDAMHPRASVEYRDHRRLSTVLFAEQEISVLVVGDEEGDVTVFRLDGSAYNRYDLTDDEQETWLEEAVRKQLT